MDIKSTGNLQIDVETGKTTIGLQNDDGTINNLTFKCFTFASQFMRNYTELNRTCKCKEDLLK